MERESTLSTEMDASRMRAKVLTANKPDDLEKALNDWFHQQPADTNIKSITQSPGFMPNGVSGVTITIIYTEKKDWT